MPKGKRSLLYALFTWMVIFSGYLLVIGLFPLVNPDYWRVLLVFTFLSILAEWLTIELPHGHISLGFAVVLVVFILFGVPAAALVSVVATLICHCLFHRENPLVTTLFNGAQYALAAIGAGLMYNWAGGVVEDKVSLANLVPLLAFVGTYFLINHLLVNLYLIPLFQHYSLSTWKGALKWDLITYLLAFPVGILMALFYEKFSLAGAVLLFLPVLTVNWLFRLYINLEIRNRELSVLYQVAKTIGKSLDLERTLRGILLETKRVVPYHTAVVYLASEDGQNLFPAAIHSPLTEQLKGIGIKVGEGIIGWVAKSLKPEIIFDAKKDPRGRNQPGLTQFLRSLLIIPLVVDNRLIGVMALGREEPGGYTPKNMQLLTILSGQAAVAMANALLYRKIEELAITDGLTQLYNYRYFYRRLHEEVNRASRYNRPFSVIMMDLDNFKSFNDRFGHQAGDLALATVAKIIKENIRSVDVAARYGGEELALLLPETDREEALTIAERIRAQVAEHVFSLSPGKRVVLTLSLGVASFPRDGVDAAELIEKADQALYLAKETGKNRVCSWSPRSMNWQEK